MLRDVLVAVLVERLNNRTDLEDAIVLEMQLAQEFRLEQNGRFIPWFMITSYQTFATVAGQAEVTLPSEFVSEVEEQLLWVYSDVAAKWLPLKKIAEDVGESWVADNAIPEYYSLVGDSLVLFPTPDAVYNLRWKYAAKQPALDTNIENAWLKYAADLLECEVGEALAKKKMQNEALASVFRQDKLAAWERLYVMHEARAHANRTYTMGED